MKARSLLATSTLLLLAFTLPLLAQETPRTPETPTTDTAARKKIRIRIDDRSVNLDSIRTMLDDQDLDDMDLDIDADIDTSGGAFDFQMNGTFNQEEFQEKMQQFQEKFQENMRQFQEKRQGEMMQWQEGLRHDLEQIQIETEGEDSGGGEQVIRFMNGDSNVVVLRRSMRVRSNDVDANARTISSLQERIDRIREELKGKRTSDARRKDLMRELKEIEQEIRETRALNAELEALVITTNDGRVVIARGPVGDSAMMGVGADCAQELSIVTSHGGEGGRSRGFMMRMDVEDSACNGVEPRLLIKTLSFTGDAATLSPQAMAFDDGTVHMQRSAVVIAGDTVRLADGRDGQTVIRIDHGQSPDGKAQIVIMSIRRGAGKDAARSSSAPLPPGAAGYLLGENFPNPVSTTTTIDYTLPAPGRATISIFDNTGRLVKTVVDQEMDAGAHSVVVDTSDLPSGLYLYRMVSGRFSESKTMTVTK